MQKIHYLRRYRKVWHGPTVPDDDPHAQAAEELVEIVRSYLT